MNDFSFLCSSKLFPTHLLFSANCRTSLRNSREIQLSTFYLFLYLRNNADHARSFNPAIGRRFGISKPSNKPIKQTRISAFKMNLLVFSEIDQHQNFVCNLALALNQLSQLQLDL